MVPCIAIRAGEWSSRALYARLSGSEIAKVEGDRIERTDAHRFVVLRARDQQPLPVVEFEPLKGVDLALWLEPLDALDALRRAKARALRTLWDEAAIGIASHQVDVFILEPATGRYLASSEGLYPELR